MSKEKCLCIFEYDGKGKININEIKNLTSKEVFEKKFVNYCENKKCDRICPLEVNINCIMNFLFDNYDIIPKGVINNG